MHLGKHEFICNATDFFRALRYYLSTKHFNFEKCFSVSYIFNEYTSNL